MAKKNIGTFKRSPKGNTGLLYIPADIVKDSLFPIREEAVTIRFQGNSLIIEVTTESWERGTFKLARKCDAGLLYIPAHMVKNSMFPLKEGPVIFHFDGNRIVVEQSEKSWTVRCRKPPRVQLPNNRQALPTA